MVLEATMIIVDNSESSRNGDYLPNRFGAQAEAVNLIFNAKTGANPESSVGLMSMGGVSPTVLVTLTTDIGKILNGLHSTKIKGSSHLATSISVAALALKHRQNKSQRQRIIVFTCSPVTDDEKTLVKLAKKMKKINVNIDFIAFGDSNDGETRQKLEAFTENVAGGDGSYLAIIPPGPNLLSDSIITTPILSSGDGGAPSGVAGMDGFETGAGGAGGNGFDFGIDPSADPELAMALRMSMEEEESRLERQRREQQQQQQQQQQQMESIPEEGQAGTTSDHTDSAPSRQPTVEDENKDGDDDKMDTA